MSDSTQAITPELIDALVKALEPKLESMVEAQVRKVLAEESTGTGASSDGADVETLVTETKAALSELDVKLWVVDNDTKRRFERLEEFVRGKRRP
jgi:hypothetical protein